MIFKSHSTKMPDIEYRCDVTLREDCLEYDVTIINAGGDSPKVTMALEFELAARGAKVVAKKGYTSSTDTSVETDPWSIPVGKFKETGFYAKICDV